MSEMLNQILDLRQAARQALNVEAIELRHFCEAIVQQFRLSSNQSHPIELSIASEVGTVWVDAGRLRHILDNLLSNAIKYSPPGRTIYLDVEQVEAKITFKVRDQGIGIPPESLEHIFTPFHRADNALSANGNGLGLAIVKEYVDALNGEIRCESLINEGTTFTVNLPEMRTEHVQSG